MSIFIVVSSKTSQIARPLTHLLSQDIPFFFDSHCHQAFKKLKVALTFAPIIQAPDWNLPLDRLEERKKKVSSHLQCK